MAQRPCTICRFYRDTLRGSGSCHHPAAQDGEPAMVLAALQLGAQIKRIDHFDPAQMLAIRTLPGARERGLFDYPYRFSPLVVLECRGCQVDLRKLYEQNDFK